MITRARFGSKLCPAFAVAAALVAAQHPHCHAAQSASTIASQKLVTKVHLMLGPTTIDKTLEAISAQTGLKVKPAEYLRGRKVTVSMDNISAQDALNALNELNDWTWAITDANTVLVVRRRLRMDAAPASVPRLLQAAVPKDMRTFLAIPTPTDNLEKTVNVFITGNLPGQYTGFQDRLFKSLALDDVDFVTSLMPTIMTDKPIAYSAFTPQQQRDLLALLVFPAIYETGFQLLHSDLPPHVGDIAHAEIALSDDGSALMISSVYSDGKVETKTGFGAPIH